MQTFVMLGKYTAEALKGISAERTKKVTALIEQAGGKVQAIYALLGEKDLILVVTLPGVPEAMKASVALSKLTNIAFTTAPALTGEEFDKIQSKG
jgi:uncharacterized protein with GYD domain